MNNLWLARILQVRQTKLDSRKRVVAGDGSYTNAVVLKGLPAKTVYIGRIRRDALLNALSGPPAATGRPRRSMARRSRPRKTCAPTTPWPSKALRLMRQAKNQF
jgi:hypothetical protein